MAPLAETAARGCFRIRPSVQMRKGRFESFAASPRRKSRSWKVKGAPGGRSDRSPSGQAPWWEARTRGSVRRPIRSYSLPPQGVGCERRQVLTPASGPMRVHAGHDESVAMSSPAEPGALNAFVRTRLYRRLQISPRDVVHRPSGRARLGCNAKWRTATRASVTQSS